MISYVKGESPLPEAPAVYRCSECAARVPHMEALQAPDPFDEGEILFGCPRCRSVNTLEVACIADGCHAPTAMGVPGRGGYRYVYLCIAHNDWNGDTGTG